MTTSMNPRHHHPTGAYGTGSSQLDDDRMDRLRRMASNLQRDLMRQDGLGPELRAECLARVERWLQEADGIGR